MDSDNPFYGFIGITWTNQHKHMLSHAQLQLRILKGRGGRQNMGTPEPLNTCLLDTGWWWQVSCRTSCLMSPHPPSRPPPTTKTESRDAARCQPWSTVSCSNTVTPPVHKSRMWGDTRRQGGKEELSAGITLDAGVKMGEKKGRLCGQERGCTEWALRALVLQQKAWSKLQDLPPGNRWQWTMTYRPWVLLIHLWTLFNLLQLVSTATS